MGKRSGVAHNCSRRRFQIVYLLNLKVHQLHKNGSRFREKNLSYKFKMGNNPKSFLDDEVEPLSGQGTEDCNSELLKNYPQGNLTGQWRLRQKRIPRWLVRLT